MSEEAQFILPIGFKIDGREIKELPIAETKSFAEKIYTKKPKQGKAHTWFAEVISASVESIDGVNIASDFEKSKEIPSLVKQIPFLDAGSLVLQIQKNCWEPIISDQVIRCSNCGTRLTVDIELDKIEIPTTDKVVTEFSVKLTQPHYINTGIELLSEFEGIAYNKLHFRVPTLGDAIRHEGIAKDEIEFWKRLAFDCLIGLSYVDNGTEEPISNKYKTARGMKVFDSDLNTKQLKELRKGLQLTLPSMKTYYEEECSECNEVTQYYAQSSDFFRA